MAVQKVGIVAECMCDLPKSYISEHNIDIIYFLIETDSGVFTDTDEITADNIFGYILAGGQKTVSSPPPVETYENIFRNNLKRYDEIIFIATGSGTSNSFEYAEKAVSAMGRDGSRVHVFDSKHLSTGLGHIVIKGVQLAEEGKSAEKIIEFLTEYRKCISTSFIAVNVDYLYRNGRISQSVKKICDTFSVHPVLTMNDGKIVLKSVLIGNYEKACLRYVRRELKKSRRIDKDRIFITHAGCTKKKIERIKAEVKRRCRAENIVVTKASATVSCNCGPDTFGVIFVNDR